MTESSSEAGPPRSFFKKIFGSKHTEQGSSVASKKDNLPTIDGIDRRQFLIGSLAALLAWKARRTSVAKAASAIATTKTAIPASPDVAVTAKKLPKRVEVNEDFFEFEDVQFVNREGKFDSMKVLGHNKPLSSQEMDVYLQTRMVSDIPPGTIRTQEIFVGSDAWNNWRHLGTPHASIDSLPAQGEHILSYIKWHFVTKLNQILENSRPESGIQHIRMDAPGFESKIIIVDEKWLRENSKYGYGTMTTWDHSPDVYARYFFPANYVPNSKKERFDSSEHITDRGLLHEIAHYSLLNLPHLYNYYFSESNWNDRPIMPWGARDSNVRLYGDRLLKEQLSMGMLLNNPQTDDAYGLSQPEELFINRAIRSGIPHPDSKTAGEFNNFSAEGKGCQDFGEEYRFVPEFFQGKPADIKMYEARLRNISGADDFQWNFDLNPAVSMAEHVGEVVIDDDIFSGGIISSNDSRETKLAKAFILVVDYGIMGKRVYGFTSYHLQYWHYLEQIKHGEMQFGSDGRKYPVTVNLSDFE